MWVGVVRQDKRVRASGSKCTKPRRGEGGDDEEDEPLLPLCHMRRAALSLAAMDRSESALPAAFWIPSSFFKATALSLSSLAFSSRIW